MEYQHTYVISTFSPIFPKGFKEFFTWHIHTSPDFSHRGFQKVFRLITRPQEDQIDYKITRRTKWSKGSVMKQIISDQFCNYFIN